MEAHQLAATLDAFFDHLQTMNSDSPPEAYDRFASFLSPDCETTLRSMRESLVRGRQAAVDDLKQQLKSWHLDTRRVISQAVDAGQRLVLSEMANRISIMGDVIDPFPETAVFRFDEDGLITTLKIYSCRSPLVWVLQKKLGVGPYSEEEMKAGHSMYNVQPDTAVSCCD